MGYIAGAAESPLHPVVLHKDRVNPETRGRPANLYSVSTGWKIVFFLRSRA